MKAIILVVIYFNILSIACAAEGIRGAAAVLKGVDEATAKSGADTSESEAGELTAEMEKFKGEAAKLDANAAAQRWLDLVTRFTEARPDTMSKRRQKRVSGHRLIAALPPPESWQALVDAIQARPAPKENQLRVREMALGLLSASLSGDAQARQKILAEVEASAAPLREAFVWRPL